MVVVVVIVVLKWIKEKHYEKTSNLSQESVAKVYRSKATSKQNFLKCRVRTGTPPHKMTAEEKLIELAIKQSKLEEAIEVCKCPLTFGKLMSELSRVRYKMECCKTREQGVKTRPENYVAPPSLRDY